MKSLTLYLALVAFAGAIATAHAGTVTSPQGLITEQGSDLYLAHDTLIGVKVHDSDGTIVGDIEDLIIDNTNRVIGVVIGTGGILGLGEKRVGVMLTALNFEETDNITHAVLIAISKDALDQAPEFQRAKAKKSLLQSAKEKAQELTDKTTATSKAAYEKAKPTLETVKETVKEGYEKAKDAAQPAIDAAKDAITPNP